jgi:large subunit ribosomal protein L13
LAEVPEGPRSTVAPTAPAVIDATGLVLGRAASLIAQRLLAGESIVVVNSEKCVITGSRENVLAEYTANRARGSKRMGPHYPRYPDRIFRRTVRGMVPHLKTRGKEAFDRLEVFIGTPPEYQEATKQTLDGAKVRPALRPPVTLEEITRLLGARI